MTSRAGCVAQEGASAPLGAYKTSMLRLLAYVGLTGYGTELGSMPEQTKSEKTQIDAYLDEITKEDAAKRERLKGKLWKPKRGAPNTVVEAVQGGGGPHGNPTVFLSFEESLEWRAFLRSTPATLRHEVTVKRRLSLSLWKAHCRGLCVWCWFPQNMCLCPKLDELRASLLERSPEARVHITMVLHAEELMRSTNSGHIAAYILDAPLRVWGCPDDNAYLSALPPIVEALTEHDATTPIVIHNAVLYPETDAATVAEFIESLGPARHVRNEQHQLISSQGMTDVAGSATSSGKEVSSSDHAAGRARHSAHLLLFDSTWGQALSLNRHVNREVPRVALVLDEAYKSLFARLRKRTREGGVSTLEATSMAVEQCVAAMGYETAAEQLASVLTDAMKSFVDLKCVLKFTDAEFNKDADILDDLTTRRDHARREEAAQRYIDVAARVQTDAKARALLAPPVLNYCYCCECIIGWHRMPEHVLGRTHRAKLRENPTSEPSEASRKVKVLDFQRPPRRKPSQ